MEVLTELRGPGGALEEKAQLWYASETSVTNEVFGEGLQRVNVLAWSHPGVQLALSGKLNDYVDISASGYRGIGELHPSARGEAGVSRGTQDAALIISAALGSDPRDLTVLSLSRVREAQ